MPRRSSLRGSSLAPVLVFAGIVGLSGVFFLIFTGRTPLTGSREGRDPGAGNPSAAREAGSGSPKPPGAGGSAAAPAASGAVSRPAAPKKKPAVPVVYPTATALMEAITAELRAGDLENAMKRGGKDFAVLPGTNFLKLLLTKAGYQVPASGPVFTDAGAISRTTRYRIALVPAQPSAPAPAGPLWVDAARDAATGSWRLTGVIISPALLEQGTAELRRHGVQLDPAALAAPTDPLTRSHAFLAGVLGQDFRAARLLTDREKIAQEKLAGLCIVFEEGEYELVPERPVVVTAASRDAAIALVRVHSAKMGTEGEIGITLHPDKNGAWQVEALDFSRLLESYVRQSGAGKVFYSPVVKSPQGGESLVVYFDFNSAELGPRAQAQLKIVAGLLATDKARKLRISGHADDLGTDDFNYRLSAERAKKVRAQLHSLGVDPVQIETLGFGATAPLDPNRQPDGSDNPEGRSRNRRTEIYLDF